MDKKRYITFKCTNCGAKIRYELPMTLEDTRCDNCDTWNGEWDVV